jgi:hypothetical protein
MQLLKDGFSYGTAERALRSLSERHHPGAWIAMLITIALVAGGVALLTLLAARGERASRGAVQVNERRHAA